MSGSIAGDTHARNRSGNYIRARTKPVNPNTAYQQAVRSSLTFLVNRWAQGLSFDQRTAWNLYAASVVMTNKLGESINLSGMNHYVRSNSLLKRSGTLALVDDGPVIFEIPDADPTFALVATVAAGLSITFDNTLAWANEDNGFLFVFQGYPQNKQRNFFAGPWRAIGWQEGDVAAAPATPWVTPGAFPLVVDQRCWLYARILRADGRISSPFRCDDYIGA